MGKIKKIRTVIDTNVIVSAILFGGIPGELISLWKSGHIQPLASKDIIDEYIKDRGTLQLKYYHHNKPYYFLLILFITNIS